MIAARAHGVVRILGLALTVCTFGVLTSQTVLEVPVLPRPVSGVILVTIVATCLSVYPLISLFPEIESSLVRMRGVRATLLLLSLMVGLIGWLPLILGNETAFPAAPLKSFAVALTVGWALMATFGLPGLLLTAIAATFLVGLSLDPNGWAVRALEGTPSVLLLAALILVGGCYAVFGPLESRVRSTGAA